MVLLIKQKTPTDLKKRTPTNDRCLQDQSLEHWRSVLALLEAEVAEEGEIGLVLGVLNGFFVQTNKTPFRGGPSVCLLVMGAALMFGFAILWNREGLCLALPIAKNHRPPVSFLWLFVLSILIARQKLLPFFLF